MKTMKKLFSIVLVLALVLSLGISAMAATITVKNTSGDSHPHTYKIYPIFTGTQAKGDTAEKLASVDWAGSFKVEQFKTAIESSDLLKGKFSTDALEKTAKEMGIPSPNEATQYAAIISTFDNGSPEALELAHLAANCVGVAVDTIVSDPQNETTTTKELPNGYYLIIDETSSEGIENFVYNETILQVTEDVTIAPKYEIPESNKKVLDTNDTEKPVTEVNFENQNLFADDWGDSADHDIGDTVYFKLTGTLKDLDRWDSYRTVFHDTEGNGLEFNKDSVEVSVNGTKIRRGYTVNVAPDDSITDGCTFEVVFDDVKKLERVTNNTEIVIVYSCTLGSNATIGEKGNPNEMQMEYTNSSTNEGTGKTPWDKVIVFTYKLDTNKVDGRKEALGGAGFILLKEVAEGTEGYDDAEAVEWKDLHTQTNNMLIKYNDVVYKVVKNYGEVGENTKFGFDGIDDGNYLLVESIVPDGYNKADDMEFVVGATHDEESENPELKELTVKDKTGKDLAVDGETGAFTVNVSTGIISNDVVNQSGLQLPETGGIGTTILYVVGGVLVAVAVIFLITKKRMGKAQR